MTQTIMSLSAAQQAAQPLYEISEDDRARQQRIRAAWQAYNGELEAPLTKMPGQPDDNVLSNRCQPIVDRGVDFLFGKEIEISVEEGAPQEAQDFLDDAWGRKEARIPLLQKLAMNGAIAGRAFLRIVPGDDVFRLVVVDPSIVFVQTAPQDCETVLLYCIEYTTPEKELGKFVHISYREEIRRIDPTADDDTNGYADVNPDGIDPDVTWQIQHWSRKGDRGPRTPAGEPITWPYPFPPLFSCQNLPRPNDFWGTPDITPDLIGLNSSLNLVLSCINRILKLYGQPILYATGVGEQVIDFRPGKIIGLPLTESKIVSVTLASDVANALSFAGDLRSDIDELSGVPGVATGRIKDLPRGALSGVTVELLHSSLLKKTDRRRCSYGELIIAVSKALLVLNRMSGDIDINIAWQNPLPSDDLASAQNAVTLKQIGISDTTLQRNLGYDPDEEQVLNQAESAQKLTAFSRGQGFPPMPPTNPAQQQDPEQTAQDSPFLGRG